MKSLIKASGLALVGLALGCAASPEPQRMQPASATLPNTEPQVNMTVTHGDQVTAIDDALIVRDAQGRSFLMLFDGDVSCEHTLVAGGGVPEGLILQAELGSGGEPVSWTFYRNRTIQPLNIGSGEANYRSGPGGGSLAMRSTVFDLPFEVNGSYEPDYCY